MAVVTTLTPVEQELHRLRLANTSLRLLTADLLEYAKSDPCHGPETNLDTERAAERDSLVKLANDVMGSL